MINKFDIDGDGMVSFPEFLRMMVQDNGTDQGKDIARVVGLFDNHNTGYMDLSEVENILLSFGDGGSGPPSEEEAVLIKEMINELKSQSDLCVVKNNDEPVPQSNNLSNNNNHINPKSPNADHFISTSLALSILVPEEDLESQSLCSERSQEILNAHSGVTFRTSSKSPNTFMDDSTLFVRVVNHEKMQGSSHS